MNLEDLLRNPQILDQLGRAAGVSSREAQTGLEALLPAVTRGMQRNARGSSGLESLIKALGSGAHDRYVEQPDRLGDARTRLDGNAILGHVFGSKDVSRNVAAHAAESSGLDASVLKQMLPIVASIAMGALSKQSNRGNAFQQPGRASGGSDLLGSVLGSLLAGGSGGRSPQNDSALDDVLDLAKALF